MTAIKPVLELYIDANILLVLAYCLWRAARALFVDRALAGDFRRQLTLQKSVLLITLVSPALAYLGVLASAAIAPGTPMTVSDIAVATFLNGEIEMSAVRFEALLSTRDRLTDAFLAGDLPWAAAFAAMVAAGTLCYLARLVRSLAYLRRTVRGSYLWRSTGRTDIRLSDRIHMPFAVRGLRRRHVVLPSELLTRPQELKLILAHEFEHLRSGDVEWELAFELLRPLVYWNPAFGIWKAEFDRIRELSCDQSVVIRGISPGVYATCLLDFCERRQKGDLPKAMNVAFVKGGSSASCRALEARMAAIFTPHRGASGAAFAVSILAAAALMSLAAASVRKPGDWSHDRLMLSTVVNLERLEIRTGNVPPW